jgi:hypothetical protein
MSTIIELYECKPYCDFEKAVSRGRARWHCGVCGRDLGIEYFFWAEAVHPEYFKKEEV